MKILHVSIFPEKGLKHAEAGGVSSYTRNLISNLPTSDGDTVYIVCNKINDKNEYYEEEGVMVHRCFNKDFRFIFQILKEIKRIKPDVVHLQHELNLYGNPITAYLFQWLVFFLRDYKTITTIHGVVSIKSIDKIFVKENSSTVPVFLVKLAFFIFYAPICFFSKKVIVHEEVFRKILIEEYWVSSSKIEVVPHGIEDLKTISTMDARKYLNLPLDKKIVLFMGYLTGYKGIDLLIDGFSKYIIEDPDVLLIIGAGVHPKNKFNKNYMDVYNSMKEKAEKLLVDKHTWVGFIAEDSIKYYFSASDLSIYPYTYHLASSGPMSISIGYEKPFLASDVFDNLIEDKNMLFKKNPQDMVVALKKFFLNKDLYEEQIKKLKESSLWGTNGKKLYDIYTN
jgi:glycosyltransferase involved in cell wall biosynthesis